MIAVDTNILVYAHREDSEFHKEALTAMLGLAEGGQPWALPWPCVHEFIAITTHPSIYDPPTPPDTAFEAIAAWIESPGCVLIGEGPGYFDLLRDLAVRGKIKGSMIHDTRIAAICLHNGVDQLWTADRDFSRHEQIKTVNPLV